jgi:S-formylglutathione hydrolase FrmB
MGDALRVLAAAAGGGSRHGLSLLHGWLPVTIQVVAAVLVLGAIGWRSRRWRLLWLPIALAAGVGTAAWAHWYVDPNAGTKNQTIKRLFGGDAAQWAAYDPSTVITRHGPYQGIAGWFAISSDPPPRGSKPAAQIGDEDAVGLGGRDAYGRIDDQTQAANTLCSLGRADGIDCAVVATPGRHDWPFASRVFASSLPWLAGQIGTPGVPRIPLPDNGGHAQAASRSASLAEPATTNRR